jgi:uroporphyrinogen III methyltransferase/synthase
MPKQTGKVYLVGAGPGSIDHLTLWGQQVLAQADVLVYDALVDERLLQLAPSQGLKLHVGKRGGQASTPQAEINRLLVEYALQGQQVVRLKSGDPFIFGRSTSEIQALIAADCPFQVVPGVSSAIAAPTLAGIPLTDPVLSRCFAVLSAHEPESLDWENLSHLETLVILMGGRHLPQIVEQLLHYGRSPHTPIAVIRWAGYPHQQVWTGTLTTIVQQTSRQSLSPTVIVIGEVVGLRPYLQSSVQADPVQSDLSLKSSKSSLCPMSLPLPDPVIQPARPDESITPEQSSELNDRPLTSLTVLVTRSLGQSSEFSALLRQQGATVLEMPAIEIGPPSSWAALDQAIHRLSDFDWLILTSTNGVDYFFERLAAQDKDARALAGMKIAVVGKKTAAKLQAYGLRPDFVPPNFVADALIEHFPDRDRLPSLHILFPRVETGGREVLVKDLTAEGATVTEVAAYQSGCATVVPADVELALQQNQINLVTFASSKTVGCFCQLLESRFGVDWQRLLAAVQVASIGPQTSVTCQERLGPVDIEAQEYTLEGLIKAIVQTIGSSGSPQSWGRRQDAE